MENLRIMRRNSEKNCAQIVPMLYSASLIRKKWKTCAGNYCKKCAVIRENCAKIVLMFYSARLVKNYHDE